MDHGTHTHWGSSAPVAPSIRRQDPLGWLGASCFAGAALFIGALALLWRPLPLLPTPPWGLGDQIACWARQAMHWKFEGVFAFDARVCASSWASLAASAKAGAWARLAIAACLACAPAWLLWPSLMRPRDGLIHIRGGRRYEGAEASRRLRAKHAQAAKAWPDHELAPGVPFPGDMWNRHILLAAGTGSGKSTILKRLIARIVEAREPMLLFDPKGDFTSAFAAPVLIAPWDARSHAWDIAKDMRNKGDMRRFAESVIADSTDPMWGNAARQILVGLLVYLQRTKGATWGWTELAELIASPQATMAQIMRSCHPEAIRLVEKATVTSQGVLINLNAFCSPIFDLAEAWSDVPESRRVSFVDWTLGRAGPRQIILQGHNSYPTMTRAYARAIIETVSSLVGSVELKDNRTRKRWLICDEAPLLGRVDLRTIFSVGRSKNFRCIAAFQDFAQLEEIHGDKTVRALTSMTGTLIVGQFAQGETAEQIAKAMGTREVERPNLSQSLAAGGAGSPSTTLSYARDEVALYKPAELASRLGAMPGDAGVVFAVMSAGSAYELTWPLFPLREERPSFVPAAWTLGAGSFDEDIASASETIGVGVVGGPTRESKEVLAERSKDSALNDIVVQPACDSPEVVASTIIDPNAAPHHVEGWGAEALAEMASRSGAFDAATTAAHVAQAIDDARDARLGPAQETRPAPSATGRARAAQRARE